MSAIAVLLYVFTMPMTTLTSFAQEYQCGTASEPEAIECYSGEVKEFLQSWVIAWGEGDAESYLDHYSPFLSPRINQSRDEWEQERRQRLDQSNEIVVTLELDSMGISKDGELDVIFIQNYRSGNYSDVVRKQLFLERDPSGLRIKRELTLD
jgi:hypothetical protein